MTRVFSGFDSATHPRNRLSVKMLKIFRRTLDEETKRRLVMTLQSGRIRDSDEPVVGRCPFCSKIIGSKDRYLLDFVWLDGSEHYVEKHNLVPPDALALLDAVTPS